MYSDTPTGVTAMILGAVLFRFEHVNGGVPMTVAG